MTKASKRKRFQFSLDSNRDGHMTAVCIVGGMLFFCAASVGIQWLMWSGPVAIFWEWFATPDVDYASKRSPHSLEWAIVCTLWLPFSWAVSHRSILSHSLLLGLPIRLLYVFLLAVLPLDHFNPGLIAWLWQHWLPILGGCAIADTTHLLKDGYWPAEIIFGKG